MNLSKRAAAEFFGTFWLVFGGCGSAVLAAAFPSLHSRSQFQHRLRRRFALAFGLTVLTMAFAIGHISGCHLNPAVSIGLVVGQALLTPRSCPPYIVAQVLGAIAGSGVLYLIASGKPGFSLAAGFASNGYADHSPGGYSLLACFIAEVRPHRLLPPRHPRRHRRARPQRLRPHRHRPLPHPHSPHQHPRHQHLGQSRAQHRPRNLRRRLGDPASSGSSGSHPSSAPSSEASSPPPSSPLHNHPCVKRWPADKR